MRLRRLRVEIIDQCPAWKVDETHYPRVSPAKATICQPHKSVQHVFFKIIRTDWRGIVRTLF